MIDAKLVPACHTVVTSFKSGNLRDLVNSRTTFFFFKISVMFSLNCHPP